MTTPTPRCSIVIPVYGKSHLTHACISTLLQHLPSFPVQIIVVDDVSPDDTLQMLERFGDRIEVVRRATNGGYAKACNSGLAVARGEYVVFLNNDTESEHQWLEPLVAYADAHPRAGVVGCRLLYPNKRIQHAGVAFVPSGHPFHIYAGHRWDAPYVSRSREMQAVTGAVALSPRHVLEQLGGYDDYYLNELEDVDLCLAARELGYQVHYCADAIVTHRETSTRTNTSDETNQNWERFIRKWRNTLRPDVLGILERDGLATGTIHTSALLMIEYDERYVAVRRKRSS